AAPPGRDVLRRIGGEDGCGAARRRRVEAVAGRAESDCRARLESAQQGGIAMSGLTGFVLGATMRVSVVSAVALSAASLLRGRSAAMRHWVLAIAVGCAAVMPLLQFVVPSWQLRTVVDAG